MAAPPFTEPVAWKINREVVMVLGWGPAMLMQVAHPLVAAGVSEHSTFRTRPIDRVLRLHATIQAMLALTFGSEEDAERATARINAIHDRVQGRLREPAGPFPAGTSYSAHDPSLLRWVHATLLYALPRAYELYVGPLTPEEKDRYCQEATAIAPRLGIPEGYLPASVSELDHYIQQMISSGAIHVTAEARALAHEILHPPMPRPGQPFLWLTRLPAVGLLPEPIRRQYGLAWTLGHEHALHALAGLLRLGSTFTPPWLRHWRAARAAYAAARSRRRPERKGRSRRKKRTRASASAASR